MTDRAWVIRSALALLFSLAGVPLIAQAAGAPTQQLPPSDPAASWTIGVTTFRGADLSQDNLYLEQSLPLLILDALSGAQQHRYTIDELAAYRSMLVRDARTASELALSDLFAKRSAIFYAQGTSAFAVAPGASGSAPATAPTATASPSSGGSAAAGATPAAASTTTTTTAAPAASTTPISGASTPAASGASGAAADPFAQTDALIQQTRARIKYLDSLDPSLVTVADPKPIVFQTYSAIASAYAPPPTAGTAAPGSAASPAAPGGTAAPGTTASSGGAAAASGAPTAAASAIAGSSVGGGTGGSGDQLLPYPLVSASAAARLDKVDFLVSGTITEVEGYLILTVEAYSTALGRTIYTFKTALTPNNAFAALETPIEALTTLVLGRPWATLNLSVDPSSALVYIDGSFYGVGSLSIRLMDAGRHVIRIVAPGYEEQTQELVLAPYEMKKLAVTLATVRSEQLALTTLPAGADVYLDSEWRGRTPLLIDRPDRQIAAVIKKKEYDDSTLTLSPESPPQITVHLSSSVLNRAEYVRNLRDRFYGSFGAFAVSLALPVSMYSLTQDYGTIYQESPSGSAEEKRLKDLTTVWYYSYLGGAFVSVSLFVNMVIDIIDYLRASN